MRTPKGYEPITLDELKQMSEDELSNLLSLCYKSGKHRCETVGIRGLKITDTKLEWSDNDGDPEAFIIDKTKPLVDLRYDGIWTYGLFKKIK